MPEFFCCKKIFHYIFGANIGTKPIFVFDSIVFIPSQLNKQTKWAYFIWVVSTYINFVHHKNRKSISWGGVSIFFCYFLPNFFPQFCEPQNFCLHFLLQFFFHYIFAANIFNFNFTYPFSFLIQLLSSPPKWINRESGHISSE